jgi:hypothetical protein
MEVEMPRLKKLVRTYVDKKKPFYIHGTMGIGKSEATRQIAKDIAKEKGLEYTEATVNIDVGFDGTNITVNKTYKDPSKYYVLMDVRITSIDPSDLRGIPFPEGHHVVWLTPNWLPKAGQGIIFFDEMNLAPPSIQAAAYQLILDRRVGDYVLPDGYSIIAAGNRAIDKANVFPMAAPLKNRFSHATLLPPSDEVWRDWALENGVKPRIVSFIAFKPTQLHKFDPNSKDEAFPTHRSWTCFSSMIEDDMKLEEEFDICASCVGEGTAREYQAFLKLKNKVNIEDILKHPEKVRKIEDLGIKHSLVSGLSEKYNAKRELIDPVLGVVDYLDEEFGVFLLRMMKGVQPKYFLTDLMKAKRWQALSKKFGKFLL